MTKSQTNKTIFFVLIQNTRLLRVFLIKVDNKFTSKKLAFSQEYLSKWVVLANIQMHRLCQNPCSTRVSTPDIFNCSLEITGIISYFS